MIKKVVVAVAILFCALGGSVAAERGKDGGVHRGGQSRSYSQRGGPRGRGRGRGHYNRDGSDFGANVLGGIIGGIFGSLLRPAPPPPEVYEDE